MNRSKQRRLEKVAAKSQKQRALTEQEKRIMNAFNAFDAEVKNIRCSVPTGHKIAQAFGALAMAVDLAMQEAAGIDPNNKPIMIDPDAAPILKDVTDEISDETLAAAGIEKPSVN